MVPGLASQEAAIIRMQRHSLEDVALGDLLVRRSVSVTTLQGAKA
jgi:hypothetical protein